MAGQKRRRGCESCSFNVEQTGFIRTKMVCMAEDKAATDRSHGGHECPQFVPRVDDIEKNIQLMGEWARQGTNVPVHGASSAKAETTGTAGAEDLELAAAEAEARAARARAEAAEAEARLAEARLRAARKK